MLSVPLEGSFLKRMGNMLGFRTMMLNPSGQGKINYSAFVVFYDCFLGRSMVFSNIR